MALALMASLPPVVQASANAAPAIVVTAPVSPDITPMHDAVQACDRDTMVRLGKAEPHRRAEFALAAYAEQRTIAAERAGLAPIATTPVGKASLEAARAGLDARQKRLDDARATEQAWRTAVEELRGDFLANCERKRD